MTIHTIHDARLKSSIVQALQSHEPLTLHELAHTASHSVGRSVTRDEALAAIEHQQDAGMPIRSHDDGVQTIYWLDDFGGAA